MRQVYLPQSLPELWAMRADNPEAALYAGGTDLLVRLRAGLADPPALICLERIAELKSVRQEGEGLFLGSGTTFNELLSSPLLRAKYPCLAKAMGLIGSPQIRHMGTLGGNLVTASPAGDSLPPLYALGAEVELMSASERRSLPITDFIKGPGQVDLQPGELVAGVRLTGMDYNLQHFEKVGSRASLAISIASLAAAARISRRGEVLAIRLAWGSVGPTVVTSTEAEEALTGSRLKAGALRQAGALAQKAADPIDDLRASREYRWTLVKNLLLRLA
jgi:CO/xanthine dehydrogenase FAD-binding subunit